MPDNSLFDDVVQLKETDLAASIEEKIVDIVESAVPPADRSTASVKELTIDRQALTAKVRVEVKVKNSDSAGGGLTHFSIPSEVKFDFDIKSGQTSDETLTIKTPSGFPDISLDIGTIKSILDGDFSKALELIPNGGVVVREIKSNYDDLKEDYESKHGAENVYFASVRFVRFAGLGTVAPGGRSDYVRRRCVSRDHG